MDDDNVAEPDVLEKLLGNMKEGVGAVGGVVLFPDKPVFPGNIASSMIEDYLLKPNKQWSSFNGLAEVDHLYNTFLYRTEAAKVKGYCLDLSPVGHREETIFTYEMKRAGWKILIDPTAITWHLRCGTGGIRSYSESELWHHDEILFRKKVTEEWGIKPINYKLFVLNNGLGDHLIFKSILPKLQEKYKDNKFLLGCCYPEVFADSGIELMSIRDATFLCDIEKYSIYRFMIEQNWKKHISEAYEALYSKI